MKKSAKAKLLKKFESYMTIPHFIDQPDIKPLKLKPFIKQISNILLPEAQTEKFSPQGLNANFSVQGIEPKVVKKTKKRVSRLGEVKSDSTMSSFHCNFGSDISKSPARQIQDKSPFPKLETKPCERVYRVKSSKYQASRVFRESVQESIDEYFAGVTLPTNFSSPPTLHPCFSLDRHKNSVNWVQKSEGNYWTVGSDYEIRTWPVPSSNPNPYKSFPPTSTSKLTKSSLIGKHTRPITTLSSLSSTIITGSQDGSLKLWSNSSLHHSFKSLPGLSFSLPLSDHRLLLSGSFIQFLDLHTIKPFRDSILNESSKVLSKHTDFTFFSGGNKGNIKLWDVRAPRFISKLCEHADEVTGVLVRNDFGFISCGVDGDVMVWDLRKRESVKRSKWTGEIRGICADSEKVFTGGEKLLMWKKECEEVVKVVKGRCKWVRVEDEMLFSGGSDGVVDVWDLGCCK